MPKPYWNYVLSAAAAVCLVLGITQHAAYAAEAADNAAVAAPLTPQQIAEGWISLFDGHSLFGWKPVGSADWKVQDGAIHVTSGEQGWLMTTSQFADYELYVEFKAPASTNSGIFLRTRLAPTDPATECYELNIAPPENPFPTGSLVQRALQEMEQNELNFDGAREAIPRPDLWDGQWHWFLVRVQDDTFLTFADGFRMGEYEGDAPRSGRIGLQFREGPVSFRNIRLKPLGLQPMLNGKDLAGWNTKNAEASKFEVASNGELHVTNGRGILETDASYGDFVMQLDAFVDGDGLNSGVFFRSIPGEYADGYESQISNKIAGGDPAQPTDFGTGAIYRRTAARRVVSKDHEWFTKTIVATGPHIAVWVNGYRVTDWTDERPPSDNPREGLRLAPGTISLQGHDPTTNLRFRNLRIVELPKARANDE